jgi:hypothetical protein
LKKSSHPRRQIISRPGAVGLEIANRCIVEKYQLIELIIPKDVR